MNSLVQILIVVTCWCTFFPVPLKFIGAASNAIIEPMTRWTERTALVLNPVPARMGFPDESKQALALLEEHHIEVFDLSQRLRHHDLSQRIVEGSFPRRMTEGAKWNLSLTSESLHQGCKVFDKISEVQLASCP